VDVQAVDTRLFFPPLPKSLGTRLHVTLSRYFLGRYETIETMGSESLSVERGTENSRKSVQDHIVLLPYECVQYQAV